MPFHDDHPEPRLRTDKGKKGGGPYSSKHVRAMEALKEAKATASKATASKATAKATK